MISGRGFEVTLEGEGCVRVPEECLESNEQVIQAAKDDAAINACGVLPHQVQSFEIVEKPTFFSRGKNSFCASITARIVCRAGQWPKTPEKPERKGL